MKKLFTEGEISTFLKVKDHTVSGKKFDLLFNNNYDMLLTSPQPSEHELPEFYKSKNYISHTDSKKKFTDKLYQVIKKKMLLRKLKWINDEGKTSGNLLDIGAGTGDFLLAAKNKGWNTSGVEPNPDAFALAENKGVFLSKNFQGFQEKQFDVITMWHVLEHVPDLEMQIFQIKKLLKEDGLLVVAVPNFKSFDAAQYKEYWAAYDVPRHLWHFSKTAIEKIFGEFDMHVRKTLPLKFDSFYVSLLSEKYKNGKLNLLSAFKNGIHSNVQAKKTGEYSSLVYFIYKR